MNAQPCQSELIILKSTIWGQLKIALSGVEGSFIPGIAVSQKGGISPPQHFQSINCTALRILRKGDNYGRMGLSHALSREEASLTFSSSVNREPLTPLPELYMYDSISSASPGARG